MGLKKKLINNYFEGRFENIDRWRSENFTEIPILIFWK